MKNLFNKIYDWALKWANTRYSLLVVFLCAFADATFFPVTTTLLFIGLALLNIKNTYKLAISTTLGTVTGSMVGYSIGYFAWINSNGEYTAFANFFFNYMPGFSISVYENIRLLFVKWDFWILFSAGFTPIPYKFFSIASGVFNISPLIVLTATIVGHGVRLLLLGYLIKKIGPEIVQLFKRNLKPIAIFYSLSILAVIILIKVL